MTPYPITPASHKYLQHPPYLINFLRITAVTYMWYQLITRSLILIQQLSNFYEKKRAISSSVRITLTRPHPSAITSLEERFTFFDQCHPILETAIHYHEVLSTTTTVEPSILFQARKGPKWVNWIKGDLKNMTKTVPLVSSELPLPILTYQAQPESSNPSWNHTSKISLTTYTDIVLAIAMMV